LNNDAPLGYHMLMSTKLKPLIKPKTIAQFNKKVKDSTGFLIFGSLLPGVSAQVQFLGKLQREEVLWEAQIQTLASYHAQYLNDKSEKERAREVYSFFEISEPEKSVARLHVVLAVPLIDEATIKKTMVMIRCYKRLNVGKHVFGKNL